MGYADEIEKPSRNDSELTVTIETKSLLAKQNEIKRYGAIPTVNASTC